MALPSHKFPGLAGLLLASLTLAASSKALDPNDDPVLKTRTIALESPDDSLIQPGVATPNALDLRLTGGE